jgi:uncharacterized protein (TIGR04255 family)
MADRHYPNAPITEAVIDIQVATAATADSLDGMREGEESAYPSYEKLNATTGTMTIGPDGVPFAAASAAPIGHLARTSDGLQIYQCRTMGFALSRLAPYPHWDEFRREARRLWEKYRVIAQPTEVTRVAVRYINRIDIPLPVSNFGDYLRTVPLLSTDLPGGVSTYFMQLNVPLEQVGADCIINEAIITAPKPDVVSVVLDIDVYRLKDLPTDDDGLWTLFEQLRAAKNTVFEACITDQTRRLFE